MRYYPVNLDLSGRSCTVIGGGAVAERKVTALLAAGGRVTVISPRLTTALEEIHRQGLIEHIARQYHPGDLAGAHLVICATADQAVNRMAAGEARAARALVNVVDTPELCDFTVPAQVIRGELLITVSTGGKSPVLARRLREELAKNYGEGYGDFLEFLSGKRSLLLERLPTTEERERFWRATINDDILLLLQQGDFEQAKEKVIHAIGSAGIKS